jgi:RNA polymerase sigma-70 factor (ECF subfamily)
MNEPLLINKDILIKAQKGDLESFEYILSFYEKAVFNYCLRVVKNLPDTEDIIQETFIKVYINRKSIDPEKNIKTWIFTIATNTMYDYFRKNKRKREMILQFDDETIIAPKTYYDSGGIIRDIDSALDKINTEYKEALLLFYQQGFGYKEIAEILLIPINTVKTHISRGKDQLKDILKDEYGKN